MENLCAVHSLGMLILFNTIFSILEIRSAKAMIAALSLIFEKSAKNQCIPEDLEKEMLQIGFSVGTFI